MDDRWGISSRRLHETLIGGKWVASTGDQLIRVTDPSYDRPICFVRESSPENVDEAVAAAAAVLPVLRNLSIEGRIARLEALERELELRAPALALAISEQIGMPLQHCLNHQIAGAIAVVPQTIEALRSLDFTERIGRSVVTREPVGVVAAITPWNYPLFQMLSKIAPAFAARCPVVLKPSEVTPVDALILAEALEAADFPPGAVNLAFGTGPQIGEQLIRDSRVSMVSFTGSTHAGRRVAALAASRIKRLSLELGGKSPSIVLPSSQMEAAVAATVHSAMINSGQRCTALSRLIVPMEDLAFVEHLAATAAAKYVVGPADLADSDLGPVANLNQRHRVTDHIERAHIDGARVVWSYPSDALPTRGYFVAPHIFTAPDPNIALAQQEVFGPVLTILPYAGEDDAVAIANGTEYGLNAAVWARTDDEACGFASKVQAGSIDINGANWNGLAPFGGYKQSGIGRELGAHGILGFTEIKSVQMPRS
ncbi:aldehyde dehydrogenase family protein [Aeromicrobium sp. 636]|uniref:Aldehyde dehydrogenase family protein n=1 Tax=Aeromicrobium senzhongii TaxID=2663859 RepID=A0A8I0K1Y2_9ACTN|nr:MULTISPECIES: aldehyde dehydrogenase family protein [Aeromicrobium]MBC9225115.1 aldehyde dehydrogenase family protein [Aeromicrobium senzhongii]MCQ3997225.1 aldehyde dehydrogenase family protein [Aeromicrobium sp. 636]